MFLLVLVFIKCLWELIGLLSNYHNSVDNTYLWLINSAASSHISRNKNLFHTMHSIPLIKIDIANRESFIADQRGTINVKVISDPHWGLEDVPITWIKTKTRFASINFIRNKESLTVATLFKNYIVWLS